MQVQIIPPCRIVQATTGNSFQLRTADASEWRGEWPTDRTGDVLVSEAPGGCDGSVFAYWIGDKTLESAGVLESIQQHLDDHDVVGVRVIYAFPDSAHSSLADDLAELKERADAASAVLDVREGVRVRVKRNQGRIGGDKFPGREGIVQTIVNNFNGYCYVKLDATSRAKERVELLSMKALDVLTLIDDIATLPPITGKQFSDEFGERGSIVFAGASYVLLPHQVPDLKDGWAVHATYPDGTKKTFGERHPLTRLLAVHLASDDAMDWWLNRREAARK